MLFSDFDIVSASVAGPTLPSGGAGATVDVTTVNPPLVGAGEYCRAFSFQSPSVAEDSVGQVKMLVAEAAEYPANRLYAPDRNKAISLRAYVRLDRGSDPDALDDADNALALVGLTACTSSEYSGGYELVLQAKGSGATRSVGLVLRARQPGAFSSHAALLAARETLCTGTYALGAWYHIRLDVVPSGELARELRAFVSVDNGSSWTQVGQMRLSALEPGWRDGSEGANDFPGRNGIIVLRSGEAAATELYTHYVAAFDGRVESVDVNLPPSIDNIPTTATATQTAVSLNVSASVTKQDDELVFYSATQSNGDPLPAWLSVNALTGALSGTAPSDAQGTVEITVTATNERGASSTRLVSLDVQPAESTPAGLTLASASAGSDPLVDDLNPGAAVGTFSAVNPTGSALSYSLVSDAGDNQYFSMQGNSLVLSGTPPAGTSQLVAWVKVQNAEGYYVQNQVIIPVSPTATLPSDPSSGGSDPDPGAGSGSGSDSSSGSGDGTIPVGGGGLDDALGGGGNTDPIILPPQITSGSSSVVGNLGAVGQVAYTATATAVVTLSLEQSGDYASFSVDGMNVLMQVVPDLSVKDSYTITVIATDGNSLTDSQQVTVFVQPSVSANEASPLPGTAITVDEGASGTYTIPEDAYVDYFGGSISYVLTSDLPGDLEPWASYNQATRTLTANPPFGTASDSTQQFPLTFNAQNSVGDVQSFSLIVRVDDPNAQNLDGGNSSGGSGDTGDTGDSGTDSSNGSGDGTIPVGGGGLGDALGGGGGGDDITFP